MIVLLGCNGSVRIYDEFFEGENKVICIVRANSTEIPNVVLNRIWENIWNPVPNNNNMSFAGEGIVTKGNSGLGCAEDGTDGKSDSDNRSGVPGNVALKQMIPSSDLGTYWTRIGDMSH